jgi:hypothetical protein
MIVRAWKCVLLSAVCSLALWTEEHAEAQDLRSRLVVEIDRVETEIRETRWNLNTLEQKRGLERELALLKKLYDRIVEHEGELMSFECSGATLDPEGGPPRSTQDSDLIGSLSQGARSSSIQRGGGGTDMPGSPASSGYRFIFARQITDTEIRLLAQIVWIDDKIANERWHLNNLEEKKQLQKERARAVSALRRVRNSRC